MGEVSGEFHINALKQVVEQSPVSILITNTRGEIEYVNPAFTLISGYSKEEVIGKFPGILKSGEHDDDYYRNLWETIVNGRTWKGEFLNRKKDGTLYWESATIAPVFNDNKEIIYFVGTKEDISEKKKATEELLRSELQFRNLSEAAPVSIAKIDKSGKLLYYNDFFKHSCDYQCATVFELLGVDAHGILWEKLQKVFELLEADSFELECKPQRGVKETFVIKLSPNIVNDYVESVILIAQDLSELLEARGQIRKNEEYIRLLADNIADVIWIMGRNQKLSFITNSIQSVSGYSPQEFLKMDIVDCLPEEYKKPFNTNIRRLVKRKNSEHVEVWESRFKKKDGEIIWIETRIRVIVSENKRYNGIIGVLRDITERKESEEAIYKSEAMFRSFFENSNAIIVVIDPETEKVIDANEAAKNFYGYSSSEFKRIDVSNELIGLVEASSAVASADNIDYKNVFAQRHRLKGGKYRNVEILPAKVVLEDKILVYAIIQDVTQRRKAIEALKDSESKKLALLKIIPDLIFVLNKDGEFIDVYTDNPNKLIVQPYKLLGKKCFHIFPGGFCKQLLRKISLAIETRNIQSFEYKYRTAKNEYVIEEVRIIASGTNEVLTIIRDITRQKQNELDLKRASEEAREANRIKSVFLANISHEIRTPINAVLGFSELLQSELTNPQHLLYVDSVRTSSKTLLKLIDDLLDLSKIEAGKLTIRKEEVNLRILLNEIENVFSIKLYEKGLNFEVVFDDNWPEVIQSDELRLRQIFINLLSNAIKFTHNGHIRIAVQVINTYSVEQERFIDFKIEVEDTGIGIANQNLTQIFEAFRQQDDQDAKRYGGTGLGLTITRRIVELLNGTIQVESQPGFGSRFTIILNAIEIASSDKPKRISSKIVYKVGQVRFKRAVVLVADDVQTNRDLLIGVFKGSNIKFLEAKTGEEAISRIKRASVDLVLLDIKMPKKNGFEVAMFIKTSKKYRNIPIIGVSATPVNPETENRSIYLDEFVAKPVNVSELLRKIALFLEVIHEPKEELIKMYPKALKLNNELLTRLKLVIKQELEPVYNEITKTSSFDDYTKFAGLLVEKGMDLEINGLSYIGNAIIEATRNFDLEKINSLFSDYKKFVAELSKGANGN